LWLEKESWEQLLRAIRRVLLTLLHLCSCIQALGDIPQIRMETCGRRRIVHDARGLRQLDIGIPTGPSYTRRLFPQLAAQDPVN